MGAAKKTDREISTSNRAGVINGGTWMEHCSNSGEMVRLKVKRIKKYIVTFYNNCIFLIDCCRNLADTL